MPEFSFLDARGVGELERLPVGEAAAALAAGDALAPTWRPAPNVDGTVHESSADVLVRGRQLLSLLETQYLGEAVVSRPGVRRVGLGRGIGLTQAPAPRDCPARYPCLTHPCIPSLCRPLTQPPPWSSQVIVSPDSDNLSILQAGVLGVDLRSHRTYAFQPGEARRLQLSAEERPPPPTSFACPRPPQCI